MTVLPTDNRKGTHMGLTRSSWLTVVIFITPLTFGGVYAYAQGTKQIETNKDNNIILDNKIDAVRTEIKGELKTLKTELVDIVNKQAEYRRQDMKEIRSLIIDLNK